MIGFGASVFPAGLFKARTAAAAVFDERPTGCRPFKGTASTRAATAAASRAVTTSVAPRFARATGLDEALAVRAVFLAGTLWAAPPAPDPFDSCSNGRRVLRGGRWTGSL